jgi:hypothetical protein
MSGRCNAYTIAGSHQIYIRHLFGLIPMSLIGFYDVMPQGTLNPLIADQDFVSATGGTEYNTFLHENLF